MAFTISFTPLAFYFILLKIGIASFSFKTVFFDMIALHLLAFGNAEWSKGGWSLIEEIFKSGFVRYYLIIAPISILLVFEIAKFIFGL